MKWQIPERMIEAGKLLAEQGMVQHVTPHLDSGVWYAEVGIDERFTVHLDGSAKEEDSCTCEQSAQTGYCQHTVAVEAYLRQNKLSRLMTKEAVDNYYHVMRYHHQAIEQLANISWLPAAVHRQPIFFKFVLSIVHSVMPGQELLKLVLYAGFDKLYRVKDLKKFLRTYHEGGVDRHHLKEPIDWRACQASGADAAVLERLVAMLQDQRDTGQLRDVEQKSFCYVSVGHCQALLQALVDVDELVFDDGEKKYGEMTLHDVLPRWTFYIKQQREHVVIASSLQNIKYLEHYGMCLAQRHLYLIPPFSRRHIATLFRVFQSDEAGHITFPLAQCKRVFADVVPLLQQYGEVIIDEQLQSNIITAPVEILLQLRLAKGQVVGQYQLRYGDVIVSEHSDAVILRDRATEHSALLHLQELGFHVLGATFTYAMTNETDLYHFLYDILTQLTERYHVTFDNTLMQMRKQPKLVTPVVHFKKRINWFDVRFSMPEISDDEMPQMIRALQRKQTYHVLSSGEVVTFTGDSVSLIHEMLNDMRLTGQEEVASLHIPIGRGLHYLQRFNVLQSEAVKTEQLLSDLQDYTHYALDLSGLQTSLRTYQRQGVQWLTMLAHYHLGGVLADDMGLGKTVQVIALIEQLRLKQSGLRCLIVAPASLLANWQHEFARFAPEIQTTVISGNSEQRSSQRETVSHVWITSYQSLRQDSASYAEIAFDTIILDESQVVKNYRTQLFKSLSHLRAHSLFALSGTPLENHLSELWTIYQLVLPGLLPELQQFKQLPVDEIQRMIAPFILRRTKQQVLLDLPERSEQDVLTMLNSAQEKVYAVVLSQIKHRMANWSVKRFGERRMEVLAAITRLKQIVCDPRLIDPNYRGGSAKLQQLLHLLDSAIANNHRILVFSQYKSMVQLIAAELSARGDAFFMLTGSTQQRDRQKMVDDFNAGYGKIFLSSLKAGGVGLNLTGADVVILYDLWWNPAVEDQATSRAHRLGQQKNVQVYRLIAEGTIEERINELQQQKRTLFNNVMLAGEAGQTIDDTDLRMILGLDE